jgi:hypothetical protein
MLQLSDVVATRVGVQENSLGQEIPLDTLPVEVTERLSLAGYAKSFTEYKGLQIIRFIG